MTPQRILWYLLLTVTVLALGESRIASAGRPNVLLILTDDQGYGDFGFTGNPILKTPVIDRLAGESFSFTRFYVHSVCAPTRAALLTGRYPHRCGVWGVTHNRECLPSAEVTIAEALHGAGYRTGCFGKWHNGEQFPMTPPGQGFDEFFGFTNGHINNYFNTTLIRGSQPEETTGYLPDVLTEAAIHFMEEAGPAPFFCYVAYNTPHSPYEVPDRYYDHYVSLGLSPLHAAFFGMCANIDENVGRLLTTLQHRNLDDTTLVVFLTDNGGTAGVDLYNAGMRGKKASPHEGGHRVPLLVRTPDSREAPREIDRLAAHIDLYPTLLELCGVPPPSGPPVDGISLVPLFSGGSSGPEDRMIFLNNARTPDGRSPGAVRTSRYRLVREGAAPRQNAWQLYDMLNDPGQQHDIASEQPEVMQQLAAQYDAWIDETLGSGIREPLLPIGHAEHNPVVLNAPQSSFSGSLKFTTGPGYAHDWLSHWTDPDSRVWFEVDVAQPGEYEFSAIYACAEAQAGSTLQLRAGNASLSAEIPVCEAPRIPIPIRAAASRNQYVDRAWGQVPLGRAQLPAGALKLELQCSALAHETALEFKGLQVQRVDGP